MSKPSDKLYAALALHKNCPSPETVYAVIRAVVRAATPGRQQGKNLKKLMESAEGAAVRVLRRRAS